MLYSFPFDFHFLDPEMAGVPGAAEKQRKKRTVQVTEGTGHPCLGNFLLCRYRSKIASSTPPQLSWCCQGCRHPPVP